MEFPHKPLLWSKRTAQITIALNYCNKSSFTENLTNFWRNKLPHQSFAQLAPEFLVGLDRLIKTTVMRLYLSFDFKGMSSHWSLVNTSHLAPKHFFCYKKVFWEGMDWHSNRHTAGRTLQCHLRSKIRWFTEFCNSHYVSQFAAFFIDARAKRSTVKSCHIILFFASLCRLLYSEKLIKARNNKNKPCKTK